MVWPVDKCFLLVSTNLWLKLNSTFMFCVSLPLAQGRGI